MSRAVGVVAAGVVIAVLVPVLILVAIGDGAPASPSPVALADIPASVLTVYESAASSCPGLSWTVLAAIGKIESDHGRSTAPGIDSGANAAGAEGPMQFLPGTWAQYGDGNPADVYVMTDAVPAAARALCANGGASETGLPGALFAYNHDDTYVAAVLQQAAAYAQAASPTPVTAADLLANPNLVLPPDARQDLSSGAIAQPVMDFLAWAANRHVIAVSVLKTGHTQYVEGTTRESLHYLGRAVDIATVDGQPVRPSSAAAKALAISIASLTSEEPTEIGTPWQDIALPGYFFDPGTGPHLHVGWGL